mmetsp:Transcript_136899/g.309268  ORF Transcript_136899/g.309268 Transcript_136899/m.309268 type:complete len:672 (+) Transcript_136899:22-2037(+)
MFRVGIVLAALGAGTGPGGCQYFAGDDSDNTGAPFTFYAGTSMDDRHEVSAVLDPASGMCIFPSASCGDESLDFSCCGKTAATDGAAGHATTVNTIALVVVLVVPSVLMRMRQRCRPAEQGDAGAAEPAEQPGRARCAVLIVMGLVIALEVYVSILLANITQSKLSVADRNALLAADSFLTPVMDVFQFLEDAVMVKINFAIGQGSVPAVRAILGVGVIGGLGTGAMAAGLVTVVAFIPAAAQGVLAPFVSGASVGCSLLPTAAEVVMESRTYLLLRAWCWPLAFMNMALRGFLMGSGEVVSYFMSGIVQLAIQAVGLFVFFAKNPSLDCLGWIALAKVGADTCSIICALVSKRDLRERYGLLKMTLPSQDVQRNQPFIEGNLTPMDISTAEEEVSTRRSTRGSSRIQAGLGVAQGVRTEAIREGLCAMVLDVSFQLGITTGTYTAGAAMGIGPLYQVGAMQNAFPTYGLSYVVGLAYSVRIVGSRFVGQRKYKEFRGLYSYAAVYVVVLAIVAGGSTLPFARAISLDLAEQSCEFAFNSQCTPVYTSVFGGGTSSGAPLQTTFYLFGPILLGIAGYRILKAGMYCVFDFQFMAVAGASTFVCVFIPAILVARYVIDQPWAIVAAMYLPAWVLVAIFGVRMRSNVAKMVAGDHGPWRRNDLAATTIIQQES